MQYTVVMNFRDLTLGREKLVNCIQAQKSTTACVLVLLIKVSWNHQIVVGHR